MKLKGDNPIDDKNIMNSIIRNRYGSDEDTKKEEVEIAGFWDRIFNRKRYKRWQKYLFEEKVTGAVVNLLDPIDNEAFHPTDSMIMLDIDYFDCTTNSWQKYLTQPHFTYDECYQELEEKLMPEQLAGIKSASMFIVPMRHYSDTTGQVIDDLKFRREKRDREQNTAGFL